jgi:hypothetical protein
VTGALTKRLNLAKWLLQLLLKWWATGMSFEEIVGDVEEAKRTTHHDAPVLKGLPSKKRSRLPTANTTEAGTEVKKAKNRYFNQHQMAILATLVPKHVITQGPASLNIFCKKSTCDALSIEVLEKSTCCGAKTTRGRHDKGDETGLRPFFFNNISSSRQGTLHFLAPPQRLVDRTGRPSSSPNFRRRVCKFIIIRASRN